MVEAIGKQERAAFEAWASQEWQNSYPPDNAWKGWIARAQAANRAAPPAPALPESGVDAVYRFLDNGEVIEAGDECPSDDCSRWEPVNRWAIGCKRSSIFKIIRRRALATPAPAPAPAPDENGAHALVKEAQRCLERDQFCSSVAIDAGTLRALVNLALAKPAEARPPGWSDCLKSPQAEAIRSGKIDDTSILDQFDKMEREIRILRGQRPYGDSPVGEASAAPPVDPHAEIGRLAGELGCEPKAATVFQAALDLAKSRLELAPAPGDAVRLTEEDRRLLDKALTASTTPAYSIDQPAPVDAAGLVARLVKPLEWSEHAPPNGRDCFYDHVRAETPFGTFSIEWKGWKSDDWPTVDFRGEFLRSCPTLDAAKAAAQADYTARILSALDASALAAAAEREHLLQAKLDRAKDDLARCCEARAAAAEREAALEERNTFLEQTRGCDMNDFVQMGMARDEAEARVTSAEAEREKMRNQFAEIDSHALMLLRAIEEGDPKKELLLRANDLLGVARAAIRKETTA